MSEEYVSAQQLYLERDDEGLVRVLRPAERSRATAAHLPQQAAVEFLAQHGELLGVRPTWLSGADLGGVDESEVGNGADDIELRFAEEKSQFDSTTVAYQQTWRGIPVWRRGVSVTLRRDPASVVSVHNSAYRAIDVDLPSPTVLRRTANPNGMLAKLVSGGGGGGKAGNGKNGRAGNGKAVNGKADVGRQVEMVSERLVVVRYDAARRLSDEKPSPVDVPHANADRIDGDGAAEAHRHSVELPFPVPPAPDIEDGSFRVAREVIFRVPTRPAGLVTWLALLDASTGSLLYLRPFLANVSGLVFSRDPITAGGVATPAADAATLNTFRSSKVLPDLTVPAPGSDQTLSGTRVAVQDFEPLTAAPPTRPSGGSFDYGSRTNDFAAVNAYYHNNRFFRLVADLGFDLASYFDGTDFPLSVDHRGRYESLDGNELNASCSGNGTGGIANVDYELADLSDPANPLGLATDWRVVLHELGGHGILYDHVNWANFGFCHSAGDSFAAILSDPDTLATDRFLTFPWVPIGRRHDRAVGAGWAWGGTRDNTGYGSEQILCTSHFRIYRSLGGDSTSLEMRRFAARVMAYLMLRGVGTLTPSTNPSNAAGWVSALLSADAGDWTSEGLAGGAYGKVIRWAFEKQGLFQAPGAPVPVAREGAPPAVDVYIDDGRHGEYQHQPVHWDCQNVWNRRYADGGTIHEDPWLGRTNSAYTRVRNRGTQTATGVVVKAFHCRPGAGLTWPDDWQAMATAQLPVGNIPPGGEVTVGPFSWTPTEPDHECLLMIASATGDPSNVDAFGPGESIPEWRLVPHDNNIAQRNVHPVPAAGGLAGIMGALDGRSFTVHNPFGRQVRVQLDIELPRVLTTKGWKVGATSPGGSTFSLAGGGERRVRLGVVPGHEVTADEVKAGVERDVTVAVKADGIVIGGMTYRLDAERAKALPQDDVCDPRDGHEQHEGDGGEATCSTAAEKLLDCLKVPKGEVSDVRVRRINVDIQLKDC